MSDKHPHPFHMQSPPPPPVSNLLITYYHDLFSNLLIVYLYAIRRFQGCSIRSQVFFDRVGWKKKLWNLYEFISNRLRTRTIQPNNKARRGTLFVWCLCFFCDNDTFRKTPVLLTRIHNREG